MPRRSSQPSQRELAPGCFSPDVSELLHLLAEENVHYLIVGGEAVIFHGYARFTGDVDIFYDGNKSNAEAVYRALHRFWNGDIPMIKDAGEFMVPGVVIQFGRPPHRIDFLNQIDGVAFSKAWASRVEARLFYKQEALTIPYINLECLLENKHASGRSKDRDDIEFLSGG